MRNFLFKVLIVVLSVFILDNAIGMVSKSWLKEIPDNGSPLAIDKNVFFKCESDIVLMGASQVIHGYNPRVFSETIGLSCYNAAQDGIDIIQNYIYLKAIFDRKPPKVLVLDPFYSYLNGSMKYRLSNLNIWYGGVECVTNYFNKNAKWQERLKLKSNLYVYNGLPYQVLRTHIRSEENNNGYSPLIGIFEGSFQADPGFELDGEEFDYLNRIVKLCKENRTFLVFARAPTFWQNKEYDKWLHSYCKKNEIVFLNHENDSTFINHKELFYKDGAHLNEQGASVYSLLLAKEINCLF